MKVLTCTINNCISEYGYWGLYGNLTYAAGAPLSISNSTFINNRKGLFIYNKGIHLDGCNFNNNTQRALHCDNMSIVSNLDNCNIIYNPYGVDFQGGSTADPDVVNCEINHNTYDGILTNGSMDLSLDCNYIMYNSNGVKTYNNSVVRINNNTDNTIVNISKSKS